MTPRMSFPIYGFFGTESLSPAVFEILRSKRIGVTSLTFRCHMMSSVTWPFDCPYVISYWWSFGTKPLSLTVSEIFNVECNAMFDMSLIRTLNKDQGHSFWYQSISNYTTSYQCFFSSVVLILVLVLVTFSFSQSSITPKWMRSYSS